MSPPTFTARPVLVIEGRCVLCGCVDDHACFLEEMGGPCWWVNRDHTLCSHHPQKDLKAAVEAIKGVRVKTFDQYVHDLVDAGFTKKRATELVREPTELDVELRKQARILRRLGAGELADALVKMTGRKG